MCGTIYPTYEGETHQIVIIEKGLRRQDGSHGGWEQGQVVREHETEVIVGVLASSMRT